MNTGDKWLGGFIGFMIVLTLGTSFTQVYFDREAILEGRLTYDQQNEQGLIDAGYRPYCVQTPTGGKCGKKRFIIQDTDGRYCQKTPVGRKCYNKQHLTAIPFDPNTDSPKAKLAKRNHHND